MYTAIVLTKASHEKLIKELEFDIPSGWLVVAHHMTINMGTAPHGPAKDLVGQEAKLTATAIGKSDKVIAVLVETVVPSKKKNKHVTLAVNHDMGGKAKHSDDLTEFLPIRPIELEGIITQVD